MQTTSTKATTKNIKNNCKSTATKEYQKQQQQHNNKGIYQKQQQQQQNQHTKPSKIVDNKKKQKDQQQQVTPTCLGCQNLVCLHTLRGWRKDRAQPCSVRQCRDFPSMHI